MKPNWNIKKIIVAFIFLLICCDVSLLFAAQASSSANNVATQQQLAQIQQLQQQAQSAQSAAPVQAPVSATMAAPVASTPQQLPPIQNQALAQSLSPISQAQAQPLLQNAPVAGQYQNQFPSQQLTPYPSTMPSPGPNNQAYQQLPPGQSLPPPDASQQSFIPPAGGGAAAVTPGVPPPGALPPPAAVSPNNGLQESQPQPGMVSEQDLNNQAFNAMVKNQLPMSPEQILRLRELFNQSQFAAASTPGIPPKPVATSQLVNLEPGSTPPVIRLAQGFITSLVFIDSTGAPWPIEAYDIGNPSAFNIQWNKTDNTLMIQSTTLYTYGNLAIRLQGLATPVMITLIPGGRAVDYRVDLRIPGNGPNAAPIPVIGLPGSANPELLSVLDGVPPPGSTEYQVCGGGAQVWVRGQQLFVRTHYTLLSPGWISTMSSADGMKAYQLQKAPLLLVAANGKIVQLKIEGL